MLVLWFVHSSGTQLYYLIEELRIGGSQNFEFSPQPENTTPAEYMVPTTDCSASTKYSSDYSCEKAIDNNLQTDWATSGEGVGSWIEVKSTLYISETHLLTSGKERNTNITFSCMYNCFKLRRDSEVFSDVFFWWMELHGLVSELCFWLHVIYRHVSESVFITHCLFSTGKLPRIIPHHCSGIQAPYHWSVQGYRTQQKSEAYLFQWRRNWGKSARCWKLTVNFVIFSPWNCFCHRQTFLGGDNCTNWVHLVLSEHIRCSGWWPLGKYFTKSYFSSVHTVKQPGCSSQAHHWPSNCGQQCEDQCCWGLHHSQQWLLRHSLLYLRYSVTFFLFLAQLDGRVLERIFINVGPFGAMFRIEHSWWKVQNSGFCTFQCVPSKKLFKVWGEKFCFHRQ